METVIENGRDILTWYKAQVIVRLSTAPPSALAPSLSELPLDIIPHDIPSGPDEILIMHNGGTVMVDGVSFTKKVADFR